MFRGRQTLFILVTVLCFVPADVFAGPAGDGASKTEAQPAKAGAAVKSTDDLVKSMTKASGATSDVVRATIAYLQKYKPKEARQLEGLMKESREKFRTAFRQANYELRNLEALKKSNPAAYRRQTQILVLKGRADELVEQYGSAGETEKPQVEVELAKVLGQQFDLRVEEESAQLEQLRKQVEQTAQRIKDRVDNKERIVDRQVTRILGIDDLLVW